MYKLDIFNHIWPKAFYEKLLEVTGQPKDITMRSEKVPMMTDLDERFRVMDTFDDYAQVLSLASPPLEYIGNQSQAVELSRIGSESMAELCQKYPDRFPAFIATVPMGTIDALMPETRHAIENLGARGIQIFTNVSGKAIDAPEYQPLYDYMAEVDLPIWLHPARGATFPDYLEEEKSLFEIWWTFGWPYETSAAMARLVFSKLFDRLPELKIITHHGGGMIPFFEGRVGPGQDQLGARTSDVDYQALLKEMKKRPLDYFKMFYADTATFGSRMATLSAIDFFGADHVVFASDAPFDPEKGPMYIRETIKILDAIDIPDADRAKIYHKNAEKLMKLK
ncbi:amidohydrolase family protein [Breoghania sp. L-A4]|uniref:amidohydrolase family protein n=1 Tax=Breoghania sp. L-A4 TaxID=2304600 RepID=UPI000E35F1B4|nr:amidohydrolase family protein [Breoghania sp. L-A4]AXS40944.1 amidohydrolase [Breoghania sp. L-A4]